MPRYLDPIEPPIDGLSCRNCGHPIIATAEVRGTGMGVNGVREYRWTHTYGSDVCRPTTTAQVADAWYATRYIEAERAARRAHEEALEKALED